MGKAALEFGLAVKESKNIGEGIYLDPFIVFLTEPKIWPRNAGRQTRHSMFIELKFKSRDNIYFF